MAGSRQTGRVGKRLSRQIVSAHSGRRKVPAPGASAMEAPFVGNRAGPGWSMGCLKEPEHALALQNASALSLAFPQR